MTLKLDKSAWKRITLGSTVKNVNVAVKDPESVGIERVIAMEHLDPGELKITRWGSVTDGTTFTRRVKPGQTLFGKRRAYQRKAAYAEFDAVTSGDILVFEADETQLLPEFLPFLVQSDGFYGHALGTSAGSLSPRTNWRDLANYEFDLPPLDVQKHLADLLWDLERHRSAITRCAAELMSAESVWTRSVLADLEWSLRLADVVRKDRPLCYGVVQPGTNVEDGIGLVRVMDLESGAPNLASLKRISPKVDHQYRRSRITAGDVLVSIVGTIGRTWVVSKEFEGCNIARALARVSPDPDVMLPDFLSWVLSSESLQSVLVSAAFESARKTLNLSSLADILLPRIPVVEQEALLDRHAEFSIARASAGIESNNAAQVRQSLIAAIFGGAV